MTGIPLTTELTNQVIFDHVVNHFKTQKVQSLTNAGAIKSCAYRGIENTSCAVGCCLLNSEYSLEMELQAVSGLVEMNKLPQRFLPFSVLLARLQRVHDGCYYTGNVLECGLLIPQRADRLRDIAKEYNLSASEIDW